MAGSSVSTGTSRAMDASTSREDAAIVIAAERRGPDRVVVTVTDHGSGIPRSERTAVFETFVRFDTGGRAGLGLAVTQALLNLATLDLYLGRAARARLSHARRCGAPTGTRSMAGARRCGLSTSTATSS